MKAIKTQIQFTYEWKQREEIYVKRLGIAWLMRKVFSAT